ncbi:MAG: Fic family protein, partial [Clostridia bacterium]|nr:Fic family protein [Clostridia bacterium]
MFILDFLCIHPFSDGNGRMSRLLTLLLLYRAGYIVGKYVSIEKMIEQTKETYYEALQNSSAYWHEDENDYIPFVQYTLGVVVAAYREFSSRVKLIATSNMSKPERIREIIKPREISIGDFVLTGGELPALCVIDSVSRNIEGTLGKIESAHDDSFSDGLLEYPHYTKP